MKTKLSILILLLISNTCFAKFNYKIEVNIKNLFGKVYLYKLGSDKKIDSINTNNGIFEFKGEVNEEGIYALIAHKFIASFVINLETIKISGNANNTSNIIIDDNGENIIHELWSKRKNKLDSLLDLINNRLKRSKKSMRITDYKDLNKKKSIYQLEENKFIEDSIISKNPNKYWSLCILDDNFENFEIEVIKNLYDKLSPELKNNSLGKFIYAKIKNGKKQLNIGEKAPYFSLKTKDDQTKNLRDYKGKYILINFWASWCIPCRQEIKDLKKLYKSRSKFKKMVFISISLDDDKLSWIKALNEEKMPWINLSDLEGFASQSSISYQVKEIPYNLLINSDGNIIYIGDNFSEVRKKIKL